MLSAIAGVLAIISFSYILPLMRATRSPLRLLRTPKERSHWLYGHLVAMLSGANNEVQKRWAEECGGTFAMRGFLGSWTLITTDLRATEHVLKHVDIYQKPDDARRMLRTILGEGLFYAEGDQHRIQRRIINPAFGYAQNQKLTPTFLDVGAQMCKVWDQQCRAAGGPVVVNALDWTSRATLDIIGKAGFGYEFDALAEGREKSPLAEAFDKLFRKDNSHQLLLMLETRFPVLRYILPSSRTRTKNEGMKMVDTIGIRIVEAKKQEVLEETSGADVTKSDVTSKDVLSVLIRANLATDLEEHQHMTDREVLSQIPTFLVAGHETTSTTVSWALYALSTNSAAQTALRLEIQSVRTGTPSLEDLNALPYMDHVVRETLRLWPVVAFSVRAATRDDVIPLASAVDDGKGQTKSSINIQKGDTLYTPIWLINRDKKIWGDDADSFRPERWEALAEPAKGIPGIQFGLLSFLYGPRACVGHRTWTTLGLIQAVTIRVVFLGFAMAEIKALLFQIVRDFEFQLAVKPEEIWSRTGALMRPQLRGDNSVQLPLEIRPATGNKERAMA
ncbi:cytochrome P450 [Exidia glandulosa HHB12029]|uniref:Cytochrome P450 n=1 Tax=Exidia glandulosa HHB12029 TaxID=1314781 RepID=A0A165KNT4_EXIGL|nr:cytochrome P450 [Exidia glandulosa HHB12029]